MGGIEGQFVSDNLKSNKTLLYEENKNMLMYVNHGKGIEACYDIHWEFKNMARTNKILHEIDNTLYKI